MRPLTVFALTLLLSTLAFSQSAEKPLSFEIADVHVTTGTTVAMRGPFIGAGRYEIRTASMLDLVRTAYSVDADKVVGGPKWLELDRFDVIARIPPGTTVETSRQRLRSLLADRFKLVVRNDSEPMVAWGLVSSKKPALKPGDDSGESGCKFKSQSSGQRVFVVNGVQESVDPLVPVSFSCHNMTMAQLAELIPTLPTVSLKGYRFVADQTGLTGTWNFDLKYHIPAGAAVEAARGTSISIYDAIKELGLELTLTKLPMPVLRVESVNEHPTANPQGIAEALPALPTQFEVADVKLTSPDYRGARSQTQPGGRVVIQGSTLKQLIQRAWNLNPPRIDEVLSGPAFLSAVRVDITAKAPDVGAVATAGPNQTSQLDPDTINLMLQALLIERFNMKFHFEERPMTAFTLTAPRPKLKKADPASRSRFYAGAGPDGIDPRLTNPDNSRLWTVQNMTMTQFAASLQQMASGYISAANVKDDTGLEGGWDFTFYFALAGAENPGQRGGSDVSGVAATPNGAITLYEALEKQLGLKLEMKKRPGPVLVIDHMDQTPVNP